MSGTRSADGVQFPSVPGQDQPSHQGSVRLLDSPDVGTLGQWRSAQIAHGASHRT